MLIKYILPLLSLSIVIAIHELGHLVLAKFFKIKVETYSIGIGKKLFKKRIKDTEYVLSLVPLGGYCKLKGGDIQNPNTDFDSMDVAHPIKKIIIYFAGPFFNLCLSIIFLSFIFLLPINQIIDPYILQILGQEMPSEEYGLKKGDKVLSINNKNINTFSEISKYITNEDINIKLERNNAILNFSIKPKVINNNFVLGIYPYIPLKILNVNKNTAFKIGDIITKVNNIDVDDYISLLKITEENNDLEITLLRNNKELFINTNSKDLKELVFIKTKSYNIFYAIKNGTTNAFEMLYQISNLFINLFKTGEVTKNLSSPIRLVYDMGNSINSVYISTNLLVTLEALFNIIASVSLTLGFINLLPIPVLDGGQILFNFITLLKGKQIKPSFILGYQTVGIIIILILFTLGISNDIFYFGDLK